MFAGGLSHGAVSEQSIQWAVLNIIRRMDLRMVGTCADRSQVDRAQYSASRRPVTAGMRRCVVTRDDVTLGPLRAGGGQVDGEQGRGGGDEQPVAARAAKGQIGDGLGDQNLAKAVPVGRKAVYAVGGTGP